MASCSCQACLPLAFQQFRPDSGSPSGLPQGLCLSPVQSKQQSARSLPHAIYPAKDHMPAYKAENVGTMQNRLSTATRSRLNARRSRTRRLPRNCRCRRNATEFGIIAETDNDAIMPIGERATPWGCVNEDGGTLTHIWLYGDHDLNAVVVRESYETDKLPNLNGQASLTRLWMDARRLLPDTACTGGTERQPVQNHGWNYSSGAS